MAPRLLSASSITGDTVVNATGDDLGSIKDLMVDTENGKIAYAVLSFGGLLGFGDKLFAIPFEKFAVDFAQKRMVLNVDQERLENGPGFDKNDWPDFADPAFRSSVDIYYS